MSALPPGGLADLGLARQKPHGPYDPPPPWPGWARFLCGYFLGHGRPRRSPLGGDLCGRCGAGLDPVYVQPGKVLPFTRDGRN